LHSRKNKSEREIARITGLSRNTTAKWLHGQVDGPPKYRRGEQPNKLTALHDALRQALKVDARPPKHERRTAKALYADQVHRLRRRLHARHRLHPGVAPSRRPSDDANAFLPLAFELGEVYQFDWSEEGLVVGGIYYRAQVAHMKLRASRAFRLVAYPSQGHEMLFATHTRSFAALGGVARRGETGNESHRFRHSGATARTRIKARASQTRQARRHSGRAVIVAARGAALRATPLVPRHARNFFDNDTGSTDTSTTDPTLVHSRGLTLRPRTPGQYSIGTGGQNSVGADRLFAGSLRAGKRAAAVMSLMHSARINGHDPYAYLRDVLERLPTQPASRIDELLPHRWSPPRANDRAACRQDGLAGRIPC
jgi:hypothetical protein